MVVRAARAEVHSAKSWRRPTHGPGSRSRSADPRVRLDPISQNGSSHVEPQQLVLVGSEAEKTKEAAGRRPSASHIFGPPPNAPKRHGHRPSGASLSVGARRNLEPTSCGTHSEAGAVQVHSRRTLLRRRDRSHSSSSPSPPAFGELNGGASEGDLGCQVEQKGNDEGSDANFTYEDSIEKDVLDESYASGIGSDTSWDPVAIAKELSDLPELRAIDEAIASKIAELKSIESQQATLNERLATSERDTREAHKVAAHLEACVAQKEAELDAIAPHHSARQGAVGMPRAPPLESLRPIAFQDDDTSWSQVRTAMGPVRTAMGLPYVSNPT